MEQVGCNEVVRIFGEFFQRKGRQQLMNLVGRREEQQCSADEFSSSVQTFANDSNLKGTVQSVPGFEHSSTFIVAISPWQWTAAFGAPLARSRLFIAGQTQQADGFFGGEA